MDWPTIHAYAEETELWASLLVNSWLILSALVFTVSRIFRKARTLQQEIISAARIALTLVSLGTWFVGGFISYSSVIGPHAINPILSHRFWVGTGIQMIGLVYILAEGLGWMSTPKTKTIEKPDE